MGKYTKRFATHSLYTTFKSSANYLEPNVSVCDDNLEVHYEPIETRVICKFNITSTGWAQSILYNSVIEQFAEVEVDGVKLSNVVSTYNFETTGEHIVKYKFVNNKYIPSHAFYGCSAIKEVIIPNNIITIGGDAFHDCTGLTTVYIPDSVTLIDTYAFYSCSNLANIRVGNSVSTIGTHVFFWCNKLASIILPASLTTISANSFAYCSALNSMTILNPTPPSLDSGAFNGISSNLVIYVPAESVDVYKAASVWSNYASKIQAIQS